MKINKSVRFEEQHLARLQQVALVKGINFSDVIQKAVVSFLATAEELTSVERYDYLKMVIESKLDGLLYSFGLTSLKGLSEKFTTSLYMLSGFSRHKNDETRYGMLQTSLFEVVNLVYDLDKILFDKWMIEIGRYGRLRERYYSLYPKMCNTQKGWNTVLHNTSIVRNTEEGVKGEIVGIEGNVITKRKI